MKKIVILLVSFLFVLIPAISPTVAYAKTEDVECRPYEFLKDFVSYEDNNVPEYELRQENRKNYLVEEVIKGQLGYLDKDITLQPVEYTNRFNRDAIEKASNIIVEKKAKQPTDKYVIVSANYDNAEGLVQSILNSDGTSANGTGVAVVLTLMEKLKNVDLYVNVKFVLFCASEVGLRGSRQFVSKMTVEEMNNMMLFINLANIGAGDNSYIYDDEVHWKHYDYFYNVSESNNLKFMKMPVDKKVFMAYEENIGLEYNHQALLTDVAPFIAKRMPSLALFSGNFTSKGFVQSERYGNIMQTKDDTLKKFDEIFGNEGKIKMNNAVSFVTEIVKDKVLVDVMTSSIKEKPDYSSFTTYDKTIAIATYVVTGLILVGIVIAYIVLKDKADKSSDPIKPMYINIDQIINQANQMNQNNPNNPNNNSHEDPFGLDDNKSNNNNNNENNNDNNNNNNNNNNNDNPFGI